METDVKHPGWCGAERATIGAAEMTAVLKALIWISALLTFVDNFPFLSVVFFTDKVDTVDITEGRKVESSHPWLVSITKFFHMWVSCRLRFSFQHVPSHTGLKWNDVADEDAKSLLDGEPASGLNLNLVHASFGQFTSTTPTKELADYLSGVKVKRMASLVLLDQAVPFSFQSSCREAVVCAHLSHLGHVKRFDSYPCGNSSSQSWRFGSVGEIFRPSGTI